MKEKISQLLNESIEVKKALLRDSLDDLSKIAQKMIEALSNKRKLLIFGNGGSAADSQHMASELVGRFRKERRPLPALALSTNTSIISSLANDYDYSVVFSRQIEALGQPGDVALGISTSGNSANIIEAVKKANQMGLVTVGLTGGEGGRLARECQLVLRVPSDETPRIQEAHITCIHILCELIESRLFQS
jgi:D-sedoheptulose 7-phosphate isomerase